MDFDNIILCVPSKKNDYENKEFAKNIHLTIGCKYRLMFCFNKGEHSLTEIYSQFFNEFKNEENSIIIFLHDDIEFVTLGWGKELLRIFNENQDFGIIGIAGTKSYDGEKPWWQTDNKLGKVIHSQPMKGSWMSSYSDDLSNDVEECAVIDGLFIAINPNNIKINFDKEIKGFHFYDIDFCLGNLFYGECKIGVTTKIRLIHYSVGKFSEQWEINRKQVFEKYKDKLPINIQ